MTHLCRLTIALGILAGLAGSAGAQGFEGVIKTRRISVQPTALARLRATTAEQVFALPIARILALQPNLEDAGAAVTMHDEAVLSVKGMKLRMRQSGGADTSWYWIVDLERGTWLAVQPSRRRYAELTTDAADRQRSTRPSGRARPLGSTRTIAGMLATGYEVRSELQIARGWIADERQLNALVTALRKLAAMWDESSETDEEVDPDDLLSAHGFPLLVQKLDVAGGELGTYEIQETVSVERTSMPAALFAVPAGYQKVTIEQLFAETVR